MKMRSGVDLVEIGRIERIFRRRPEAFLRRLFTERERCQLEDRGCKPRHLASRFAAKEAIFKLLGAGLGSLAFSEVEVLTHPSGEPQAVLHGTARVLAFNLGIKEISLSLSHDGGLAVALAVALSEKNSG